VDRGQTPFLQSHRWLPDSEFCKTFFSSVTRKLFGTVGAASDIEFIAPT